MNSQDAPFELDVAAAVMQQQTSFTSTQTLAMRRSSGAMKGYWEFPGGKRESGESMSDCLIREIKEELGVTITVGKLVMVNRHRADSMVIKLHAFIVTQWCGELTMNDHDKMLWLDTAELHTVMWSPADIPIVQLLKADND